MVVDDRRSSNIQPMKMKRIKAERQEHEDNIISQTKGPSQILSMDRKPLAKRGLPLPIGAIDHVKAKEKLAKIIESTDPKSFGSSSTLASTATLKGASSLIGSRSNHPFTSKNSRDLMSSQRQVGTTSEEDAHT